MNWLAFSSAAMLAIETIRAHKMRAFLTVLGVVIGTGTIMAVGAILTGFDSYVTSVLRTLGPNSIVIFKFPVGIHAGLSGAERTRKDLTYQNAADIRSRCDACELVSPLLLRTLRNGEFVPARFKGGELDAVNLMGVQEIYANGGQVDIHRGRFLTEEEDRRRARVAVIGADVEKGLYANNDPVGKPITVDGQEFTVIGTMNPPATSFGQQDLRILIPYFTMHKVYPAVKENALVVTARDGELPRAMDEVRVILRIDRRVPYNKPDDFSLSTAEQMVSQFRQISSMVALVMLVLSSVGLLVGGIGVMNIMLVSVTERTREIGIRKAIGARRSDIILQFLLEAVALTSLGGLIGIAFGWIVALASRLLFSSIKVGVPAWAAALGIIVSVGTGLFFGIWPASKAARLDPVDALRYE